MAEPTICSVDGCELKIRSLGLCTRHYYRLRRHGSPLGGRAPIYKSKGSLCEHESCKKPLYVKGLCIAHYTRLIRHGSSYGGGTDQGAPVRWIIAHLHYSGDDCIEWPFAKARGYGIISFKGRMRVASNYMCELINGPPPAPGMDCAHSCGNGQKGCTNPNHLRWATRSENLMERRVHDTALVGSRSPLSKLTECQVMEIRALKGAQRSDDIAERFGVSRSMVYKLWNRQAWTHI